MNFIHISQGHEKGIGLEVFLKSWLTFSADLKKKFILHIGQDHLNQYCHSLKISRELFHQLTIIEPKVNLSTPTMNSLLSAIDECQKNHQNILFTLPSTKKEFLFEKKIYAGHTEFFRYFFHKKDLGMMFRGIENHFVLLLSDHISLKNVANYLSSNEIVNKVVMTLNSYPELNHVYFSGINPHAGEQGLLGNEDKILDEVILKLRTLIPGKQFHGPVSGDTLYFNADANSLLVYAYHDQGLAAFKTKNLLLGANITVGLPFKRLSVDHGTAFDLAFKNQANYLGCLYCLKLALNELGDKT